MLGTSRTVRGGKLIAFEFLRVVERDGGWVYVAQPGGAPPTEFVLTEWGGTRAFRTLALASVNSGEGQATWEMAKTLPCSSRPVCAGSMPIGRTDSRW
jgi:hypothetical protein